MPPSERAPTLAEVIRRSINARLGEVHTAIPARVVRYDASKQQVDCKPLVRRAYVDEEGERQTESLPVVPSVPVQFPSGGGFRLTFPISDGDLVIGGKRVAATIGTLFFFECSVDRWLAGKGAEVDPEIDHGHALSDAVFVPGLNPFGAPLSDCPADHVTLGADGASDVQIHLRGDRITLGDEGSAQATLLAESLLTDLKSFVQTVYSVLQAGTTGGPTAQQITNAAQVATTSLYLALADGGTKYQSTKIRNH